MKMRMAWKVSRGVVRGSHGRYPVPPMPTHGAMRKGIGLLPFLTPECCFLNHREPNTKG